jgi:hypothetical protein
MHRETLAPAGDRHVEGGLDLADVFVERAAQVGEAQVVDGMQVISIGFIGHMLPERQPSGKSEGIRPAISLG